MRVEIDYANENGVEELMDEVEVNNCEGSDAFGRVRIYDRDTGESICSQRTKKTVT